MTNWRTSLVCLSIILAAGCALTPDYERPDLGEPEEFRQPADAGESIANVDWFEFYIDPALAKHIEIALEQNRNRAAVLARVSQAREIVTSVRANQFPFIDIGAAGTRAQSSASITPGAPLEDNYTVNARLAFELDIWRKFDRATEAAIADLLATEAAYRSITIRLVADVAATYFLLLDLDSRLQISSRTIDSRRDSLRLVQARFDRGMIPEIDVNQAQVQLAIAEAAAAVIRRDVVRTENALRVLLGQFPGPVDRGKVLADWDITPSVPPGISSELLQRRPDVIAAEQVLIAETARVGVAEALRWPSVSLTGTFGAESAELSDLNSSDARIWDVGIDILAPIFNSGQRKAEADAQRARAAEALALYEASARQAFQEVEDSLVTVRTFQSELAARNRQVIAARNAARLARARYDAGTVEFLEVLDSERNLFDAELSESVARQGVLVALVRLYEALGGGWSPPES